VAKDLGVAVAEIEARANKLHEFNPMLGHRGVRLGISYPEIYEMQARAIFEAVVEVQKKAGKTVIPEIMIPLVATKRELDLMKVVIDQVASEVSQLSGEKLEYMVGTMIELPRAALRAGDIAETADFFSFGTNDLTQTTWGLSRDDSGSFLEKYQQRGILEHDPFASLDIEGVGELITIACERGRKVRNNLKLGICGEHGGDPASVFFCHKAGLDYVSCSPYRVPIARLAAAQAALGGPLKTE
jgi:pyruvate,orthophosphate dikinase